MKKKLISVFLAAVMAFSVFPVSAFALASYDITLLDFWNDCVWTGLGNDSTLAGRAYQLYTNYMCWLYKGGSTGSSSPSYGGGAGRVPSTVSSSGCDSETVCNDSSASSRYQAINTTNNSWYNPVTNNYSTYNNITYNNQYDTFNITNNEYNAYVTNNYTYLSYVIVDPETDSSWYYEIYYLLPDGRNSYNLTADDVWGTYFIYDGVNYDEVKEDDGTTLALLHFDGSISDSSANSCPVAYTQNATYNYVDSELTSALAWSDGKPHSLAITLPESLSGAYTIEGRIHSAGSFSVGPSTAFSASDVTYSDATRSSLLSQLSTEPGYVFATWYSSVVSVSFTSSYYIDKFFSAFVPSYSTDVIRNGYFYPVDSSGAILSHGVYHGYLIESPKFSSISSTSVSLEFTVRPIYQFYNSTSCSFAYVHSAGGETSLYINGLLACSALLPDFDNKLVLSATSLDSVYFDELRVSNKALYNGTYTPSVQPFDTNSVMVLPASGEGGQIAVKSNVPVSNIRVGGVRPTYPTNGYTYIYLEDNIVKDVQQYQTDGWYSVTASLYDDGAWVKLMNYDLSTYELTEPEQKGPVITSQPKDVTNVEGSSVSFSVDATGDSLSYQWYYRDNGSSEWAKCFLSGSTTNTLNVTATSYRNGMSFYCLVTDSIGFTASSDSATLTIGVPPDPPASSGSDADSSADSGSDDTPASDSDWGAIGKAIIGFFKTIGGILGAVTTGLLDLLTSVIANVGEAVSLGGEFAQMIAGFYSWLPPELTAVLAAGFSVLIIMGLIKFFL